MFVRISLLVLFLVSCEVIGQTPVLGPIGDQADFPDTQVCTTVSLSNTGSPGFGPYLRLSVPGDLSLDSIEIFGTAINITNVGVFPAPPNNQLIDPVTGETITGNEGETFFVAQPPIGSVVQGGADLDFEICFTIDANAPVNVPINVDITPVYELGDTATGDNGPITGGSVDFDVTPVLAVFAKTQSAPEGERPTGPSWPVTYTLTTDVAPNNTINNLVINDTLPPGFVLDVGSINITGGMGCNVNTTTPLNITCTSVTGTGGGDVVVTYTGYFDDGLNEAVCDATTATNNATFDADFNAVAIAQLTDSVAVDVELVSLQKSATPSSASPGETIGFTLNGQVTDFGEADSMVVIDTLPDGFTYQGSESLTVNGGAVALHRLLWFHQLV